MAQLRLDLDIVLISSAQICAGHMTPDEYGAFAEFYDHVRPYQQRPDVDFYLRLARDTGGPVLEVGCGTGRVLVPTAQAGIEVTGLDRSQAMLQRCRERLAKEPPEVARRAQLVSGARLES